MVLRRLPSDDAIAKARAGLQKLRDASDWNEATPVVHVNVQQAAAARRTTPAAPKPPDPGKLQIVVVAVRDVFHRFPPWGAVVVAVVAILAWAYLAVHGKAPVP